MKRRSISLSFGFVGRVRSLSPGVGYLPAIVTPVPGDISGIDPHKGFSCEWRWKRRIPEPENWDGNPIAGTVFLGADDGATLSICDCSVTVPPGETHVYNHLGQLTQSADASGTRVYVYNNYNEVESETLTGDAIAHAVTELRDAFGRGTGYVYAKNGSVQQTTGTTYAEATGRLATACFVHGGAEKTFTYNYLSGTNLLESLACPSNLTLVHTYEDKRDLVTGMRIYRGAGTDVVLRNYTYDALGRPLTRTTSRNGTTQNDTFGYNARSELTSATLGNANYAYAFDNIGNRETSTDAGTTLAYTANNLNQYTEVLPSESSASFAFNPSYDADGNATLIQTSTGTWSITYNGANRPVRFRNEETDTTVECGYDSQGRRYFKKVTVAGTVTLLHRYIYRGYLQIACVDCTRSGHPALWFVTWDPSQATATRPLAIQKDGTWFTYGYDITKNVCEVFGPAGYIRTAYSYAPFGNVTESGDVSQPFQWSSEHYDSELDLVYYNFRHYSPDLGRFLSRDPIAEQGGRNLYAFVKNNPTDKIDLHGRNWSSLVSPGLCIHAGNVMHYYSQCIGTCPERARLREGLYGLKEYRSTEQSKLPSVNGCGPAGVLGFVVPDEFNYPEIKVKISFTATCNIHDRCYGTCGAEKSQCDFNMFKGTIAECMKIGDRTIAHFKAKIDCLSKALIFYIAISQLGTSFFESSQDEHCKWIPCRQ